jgi:hypothetical protein
MVNWTDSIIHWNQLPGTEVKRLIDTWGKDEAFIAKYDKKHGIEHVPLKTAPPANKERAATIAKAMIAKGAIKPPAKKAVTAKAPSARQKHTGADGEIKFVEHRNLFVGFMSGRVVVTKRTEAACREFLVKEFGAKCGEKTK